jgi:hypothetical protein
MGLIRGHIDLVQGHAGKLVFGLLMGRVPAVLMVGRTQFVKQLPPVAAAIS